MKKTVGLLAYGEMGNAALQALLECFSVKWIVLPPIDGQSATEELTEKLARKRKIKVVHPLSIKELAFHIKQNKTDLVIIASFSKILSQDELDITKYINVHLGDLPRFRGRANVNWAIINGRKKICVTIHEVAPDLDAGNIYEQKMISILETDTVKAVYDKINRYLSQNLCKVAGKVINGYKGTRQKGKSTYCCTRLPEDGLIDWNKTSKQIYDFVRALTNPYPGAFTYFEGKKMIIWSAEIKKPCKIYEGRIPGRIAEIIPGIGVEVLTGDSVILIKNVSYLGKECNASDVIKSVKKTLGINWVELYESLHEN